MAPSRIASNFFVHRAAPSRIASDFSHRVSGCRWRLPSWISRDGSTRVRDGPTRGAIADRQRLFNPSTFQFTASDFSMVRHASLEHRASCRDHARAALAICSCTLSRSRSRSARAAEREACTAWARAWRGQAASAASVVRARASATPAKVKGQRCAFIAHIELCISELQMYTVQPLRVSF